MIYIFVNDTIYAFSFAVTRENKQILETSISFSFLMNLIILTCQRISTPPSIKIVTSMFRHFLSLAMLVLGLSIFSSNDDNVMIIINL